MVDALCVVKKSMDNKICFAEKTQFVFVFSRPGRGASENSSGVCKRALSCNGEISWNQCNKWEAVMSPQFLTHSGWKSLVRLRPGA